MQNTTLSTREYSLRLMKLQKKQRKNPWIFCFYGGVCDLASEIQFHNKARQAATHSLNSVKIPVTPSGSTKMFQNFHNVFSLQLDPDKRRNTEHPPHLPLISTLPFVCAVKAESDTTIFGRSVLKCLSWRCWVEQSVNFRLNIGVPKLRIFRGAGPNSRNTSYVFVRQEWTCKT